MSFLKRTTLKQFEAEALPHLPALYRTAARLTGDRAHADDIVQETYLSAWRSFDRFQPGTNCRAWLFKILIHNVQRQWKRRSIAPGEALDAIEGTLEAMPVVEDALTDEEILAAIDSLPEEYRKALLLADVEGFAYRETAEILGVPIGTVMSRLSRGRAILRRRLEHVARAWGIGPQPQKGPNP